MRLLINYLLLSIGFFCGSCNHGDEDDFIVKKKNYWSNGKLKMIEKYYSATKKTITNKYDSLGKLEDSIMQIDGKLKYLVQFYESGDTLFVMNIIDSCCDNRDDSITGKPYKTHYYFSDSRFFNRDGKITEKTIINDDKMYVYKINQHDSLVLVDCYTKKKCK